MPSKPITVRFVCSFIAVSLRQYRDVMNRMPGERTSRQAASMSSFRNGSYSATSLISASTQPVYMCGSMSRCWRSCRLASRSSSSETFNLPGGVANERGDSLADQLVLLLHVRICKQGADAGQLIGQVGVERVRRFRCRSHSNARSWDGRSSSLRSAASALLGLMGLTHSTDFVPTLMISGRRELPRSSGQRADERPQCRSRS